MPHMLKYRASIVSLSCIIILLLFPGQSVRGDTSELEYQLKAAFLLNFAKFTTWPEAATSGDATMNFCIVGENPFGRSIIGLEKKQVAGRDVRLHFEKVKEPDAAHSCQVVFISRSEQANVEKMLLSFSSRPVLTVSDIKGFASSGGMFEFITKQGRLSFIVNNRQVASSGLQVNASVLSLAAEVY